MGRFLNKLIAFGRAGHSTFNRKDETLLRSIVAKAKVMDKQMTAKEQEVEALAKLHKIQMTPGLMTDIMLWADSTGKSRKSTENETEEVKETVLGAGAAELGFGPIPAKS